MTIELYASEVSNLTLEGLGEETFVKILDPENQTEAHREHLRDLVHQRARKASSRALDANELGNKLRGLAPGESSPSFSKSSRQRSSSQGSSSHSSFSIGSSTGTPVGDDEEYEAGSLELEKEAYNALVADGGQPSHPVSLGFDVLDNPGQYEDILWFWHSISPCYMSEFRVQASRWQVFREYQKKMRGWYIKRGRFQDYQNTVREGQEGVQSPWDLDVDEDTHKQSRLQDWIEFRAFYCRKLKAQRKRIEPAEKEYLQRKREMDAFEPGLSSPVKGDDHFAMAFEADRRRQAAWDQFIAAKQKLEQAKAANQPSEQAEQEVQRAEKRWGLQHDLHIAESALYRENLEVKKWAVYLKWIDDQYPVIAAECGYHVDGMVNDTAVSKEANFKGRKSKSAWRQGRRMQPRSVLGPTSPSKISKSSSGKPNPRRKPPLSSSDRPPLNTKQNCPVELPVPLRRSERLRKSRTEQPAQGPKCNSLKPIHSSRVGKAQANISTEKHRVSFGLRSAQTDRFIEQPKRVWYRYGVSWNTSGDPESREDSNRIRQWYEYVQRTLKEEGISFDKESWSFLQFDDPFESSKFPQSLLSDGFELRFCQYGARIFYKKITGPPPARRSSNGGMRTRTGRVYNTKGPETLRPSRMKC